MNELFFYDLNPFIFNWCIFTAHRKFSQMISFWNIISYFLFRRKKRSLHGYTKYWISRFNRRIKKCLQASKALGKNTDFGQLLQKTQNLSFFVGAKSLTLSFTHTVFDLYLQYSFIWNIKRLLCSQILTSVLNYIRFTNENLFLSLWKKFKE